MKFREMLAHSRLRREFGEAISRHPELKRGMPAREVMIDFLAGLPKGAAPTDNTVRELSLGSLETLKCELDSLLRIYAITGRLTLDTYRNVGRLSAAFGSLAAVEAIKAMHGIRVEGGAGEAITAINRRAGETGAAYFAAYNFVPGLRHEPASQESVLACYAFGMALWSNQAWYRSDPLHGGNTGQPFAAGHYMKYVADMAGRLPASFREELFNAAARFGGAYPPAVVLMGVPSAAVLGRDDAERTEIMGIVGGFHSACVADPGIAKLFAERFPQAAPLEGKEEFRARLGERLKELAAKARPPPPPPAPEYRQSGGSENSGGSEREAWERREDDEGYLHTSMGKLMENVGDWFKF